MRHQAWQEDHSKSSERLRMLGSWKTKFIAILTQIFSFTISNEATAYSFWFTTQIWCCCPVLIWAVVHDRCSSFAPLPSATIAYNMRLIPSTIESAHNKTPTKYICDTYTELRVFIKCKLNSNMEHWFSVIIYGPCGVHTSYFVLYKIYKTLKWNNSCDASVFFFNIARYDSVILYMFAYRVFF